jgi:cytochrome c5
VLKALGILFFFMTSPSFAAEHHPEEFLASVQGSPDAGQKIYEHFCSTCHAKNPIIAVGAPEVGSKTAWEPFIKNQTIDKMMTVVDSGLGAMPPRGGCFECSDQDLKAAIEYMLPKK